MMNNDEDCPMEGTKYRKSCAIVTGASAAPCPFVSECRQILNDLDQKEDRDEEENRQR